jgi:hypothetical protein
VEVIGLLPVVVVVAFAVFQVLAARAAEEAAGHAAHAAGVAVLQDRDPESAARAALSGWPRANVRFARHGTRIDVAVRPRGMAGALAEGFTARAWAETGAAARASAAAVVRGGASAGPRRRGAGVSGTSTRSRGRR